MSENSNRPVYRLRYGNVVAAVWANNSQAGYFYSTTVAKIVARTLSSGDTEAQRINYPFAHESA